MFFCRTVADTSGTNAVVMIVCLSYALLTAGFAAAEPFSASANADRMEQRIKALSKFGANVAGGVDRVAFSDADIEGREYIKGLMREAGLTVRVDTAGNIIGRREGSDPDLPIIMFGSHIDSVPGGGNYDGDVGVIGAIEVAQLLHENDIATRHPLEVVSFTDEEGGLTGSLAMTGRLKTAALGILTHSGKTVGDGIRLVGGDPDRLEFSLRKPGELAAFIELHIEQGAILYEEKIRYRCRGRNRRHPLVGRRDRRVCKSRRYNSDEPTQRRHVVGRRSGSGHQSAWQLQCPVARSQRSARFTPSREPRTSSRGVWS